MKAMIRKFLESHFARKPFSSQEYWGQRYESGRNSGPGSYGHLAEFKASVLNAFVAENNVTSVMEFGCGDGNQLTLAEYPAYIGYDVSPEVIGICRELFHDDTSKKFFLANEYAGQTAELTMSLDVIYHLVEDDVFDEYMHRLFNASSKFVAIYSSNQDEPIAPVAKHMFHRRFSSWIEKNAPQWSLVHCTRNPYPYDGDSTKTSFADFYFYSMD